VQLVQVDVVDAERSQAPLDTLAQPCGRRVPRDPVVPVGPQTALGGDDDLVAP
jgi:hypothetical protein